MPAVHAWDAAAMPARAWLNAWFLDSLLCVPSVRLQRMLGAVVRRLWPGLALA